MTTSHLLQPCSSSTAQNNQNKCLSKRNSCWCFVCAEWISSSKQKRYHSRMITPTLASAFEAYFHMPPPSESSPWWVPLVCCHYCYTTLLAWHQNGSRNLSFKVPTIWGQPSHNCLIGEKTDCFFCESCPPRGKVKAIPYFEGCVTAPVLGERELPVLLQSSEMLVDDDNDVEIESAKDTDSEDDDVLDDPDYVPSGREVRSNIGLIDQNVFNAIIQTLKLNQRKGETLGSMLLNLGLLAPSTVIGQRKRSRRFDRFFALHTINVQYKKRGESVASFKDVVVVYCTDIRGLFKELNYEYNPDDWRLFLDGSSHSFKVILLHNEVDSSKRKPAVPIAEGIGLPENYSSIKAVLELIGYADHQWRLQGDFKIINIVSGMMACSCKFPCYICNFGSRKKAQHYLPNQWREWKDEERVPGPNFNFVFKPLVPASKIVPPELHIRMGVFVIFIKTLEKRKPEELPHPAFSYYLSFFTSRRNSPYTVGKLAAGAINGPDIIRLTNDIGFVRSLQSADVTDENNHPLVAWLAFVEVVNVFFGKNARPDNFRERVAHLVDAFKVMGCPMTLKLHYLSEHLDSFPVHLGAWSEQHGEREHQLMKEAASLYPNSDIRRMSERMFQLMPLPVVLKHSKLNPLNSRF